MKCDLKTLIGADWVCWIWFIWHWQHCTVQKYKQLQLILSICFAFFILINQSGIFEWHSVVSVRYIWFKRSMN